ncbi:autotransporter outer membrane beta-barrel domain-containing protein [Rickettsia endosymbiont of Orchestes rusci]|uniref:autotransporter outer membrane beta-barrel domain-containing protein n=1 Tax=Rickettsia endosymbiont of Orchestes rusci TaxID=3066250 RepID=UPI00313CF8D9
MPNIKNNKSKFVKNLMLVTVSTTMLSGVTLEAMAVDGGPPPPPPPPPPPAPAPVIAGGHDAIFDQIRQGKALKKAQAVAHQQGQPVNQNRVRLKKIGNFDANYDLIIVKNNVPVLTDLSPLEMLAEKKRLAEEQKLREAQKKRIEEQIKENKKKAEALRDAKEADWDIKRRAAEAKQVKEAEEISRAKEAKRVAETRKETAERDGTPLPGSERKAMPESELVKELRAEIDFLKSTSGNPYSKPTLETNNSDLYGNSENGIGNGNDSFEREEITRLNDEISSLKALLGEKQRNEEFLDVIEFLKQYVSEGGSIQETIGFLEEQRKKGLSLSEAIDFLEEKENIEAMLELQEQEKAIDAQLEQKAEEKITDAEGTLSATSSITTGMMDSVTDLIKSRISGISGLAAVAAGDEDTSITKGVWIAGLYGVNKQGAQKNMSGYKGNTYGSTIGFDVEFNDNDILGIAYTNMHSNFKTSTTTKGKTAVNSHVLALYGQKELPENFSLQGMFAAARNYIKNKSVYSGSNVIGKYKNDSLSFETLLNYKYPTNYELTIIPNIGIRYGSSKDGIYKDSDLGVQHLTVAAKSQNLWTGIVGTKILFTPQRVAESITLTPGLHVSIENHFNNKNKKVEAQVSWEGRQIKETIILPKQPKTGYNIGASVLAQKGNVDVLVEYNCHLQKKYQSHQGFVKLKISF